jgi:Domain of unknown function (DUF3385)
VCESTGVVVAPYMDYPQLLGVLLRLLGEGGDGGGKRGVLRLLGVLGALDPHMHKVNQAALKVCNSAKSWQKFMQALGNLHAVLGALDPHLHKVNQAALKVRVAFVTADEGRALCAPLLFGSPAPRRETEHPM